MGAITDVLFGANCARCGTRRTHSKVDDIPTCTECEESILKAKVASEERRFCPVDGAPMNKEVVHKLVLDRCTQCGGVWLDAEELDAIKKAASQDGYASGLAQGIGIG